jgi:hypothetical protein
MCGGWDDQRYVNMGLRVCGLKAMNGLFSKVYSNYNVGVSV